MSGVELIAAERLRQTEEEGWTPYHDDGHEFGELAVAAATYALPPEIREERIQILDSRYKSEPTLRFALWSWDEQWWKPSPEDRVRELVKAGALIAAEIDRLQRGD